MKLAELVLQYLDALIWPAVVVAVVLLFRQQIGDRVQQLKAVEGLGVKAQFAERLASVQQRLEQAKEESVVVPPPAAMPPPRAAGWPPASSPPTPSAGWPPSPPVPMSPPRPVPAAPDGGSGAIEEGHSAAGSPASDDEREVAERQDEARRAADPPTAMGGRKTVDPPDVQRAQAARIEQLAHDYSGWTLQLSVAKKTDKQVVLDAWDLLERFVREVAGVLGIEDEESIQRVPLRLRLYLGRRGAAIDDAIRELRRLRDDVAYGRVKPSREDAAQYVRTVTELLTAFTPSRGR